MHLIHRNGALIILVMRRIALILMPLHRLLLPAIIQTMLPHHSTLPARTLSQRHMGQVLRMGNPIKVIRPRTRSTGPLQDLRSRHITRAIAAEEVMEIVEALSRHILEGQVGTGMNLIPCILHHRMASPLYKILAPFITPHLHSHMRAPQHPRQRHKQTIIIILNRDVAEAADTEMGGLLAAGVGIAITTVTTENPGITIMPSPIKRTTRPKLNHH